MSYSDKARVFLARHGMEPEAVDYESATASFLGEMELGLHGRCSSLKMIPTYLRADGKLPLGRRVAVIDAGGTNFRTALVYFTADGPCIERLETCAMPGTGSAVRWEDFIGFAASRLAPLLEGVYDVGFCFSYPTQETPDRDGYVINLTKQVRIEGFEGRLICADLASELDRLGYPGRSFVLLNDTPAVLLSGAGLAADGSVAELVGLISGTGTNTCCVLPADAIKKEHGAFSGNMLVNLESGGFLGLPRGEIDVELDNATCDPGTYWHEKMTSGAYLGELCRLTLRRAASDGLFSDETAQSAAAISDFDASQADAAASGEALFASAEDSALASELCLAMFDRAARCVCANLSAILMLTGHDDGRPSCVCVDGSVFRRSRVFRPLLEGHMKEFTEGSLGRRVIFTTFENATQVGTAAAALLNSK